jgi:hypothetical protein
LKRGACQDLRTRISGCLLFSGPGVSFIEARTSLPNRFVSKTVAVLITPYCTFCFCNGIIMLLRVDKQ